MARSSVQHGPLPASFSSFVYFQQLTVFIYLYVQILILKLTGFKPRTSGIRSDHSANWATTTGKAIEWVRIQTTTWKVQRMRIIFLSYIFSSFKYYTIGSARSPMEIDPNHGSLESIPTKQPNVPSPKLWPFCLYVMAFRI